MNMIIGTKDIDKLVRAVLWYGAYRATIYRSESLVIKLTQHGKIDKRDRSATMLLTIGKPNYAERKFIKTLKKAGESLPLNRPQLKFKTEKKKKAA